MIRKRTGCCPIPHLLLPFKMRKCTMTWWKKFQNHLFFKEFVLKILYNLPVVFNNSLRLHKLFICTEKLILRDNF